MQLMENMLEVLGCLAGVLAPLVGKANRKRETPGVGDLVLLQDLEESDCGFTEISEQLIGITLEQEGAFLPGSLEELFLCSVVV